MKSDFERLAQRFNGSENAQSDEVLHDNYKFGGGSRETQTASTGDVLMKFCVLMPAAALWVLVNGATASGQQKETAPSKPVAISTEIEYGWSLSIVADARGMTSRVGYDAQSGVLERTRAHISVKDCERLADAIETAAKAVKGDKRFENDGVGDVTISTGLGDVYLPGRDGKEGKTEKRQCVLLGGGESGLFMKSLNMNLDPEKAAAFATAIRGVPAVYARLKSSIDFDAMFKGK